MYITKVTDRDIRFVEYTYQFGYTGGRDIPFDEDVMTPEARLELEGIVSRFVGSCGYPVRIASEVNIGVKTRRIWYTLVVYGYDAGPAVELSDALVFTIKSYCLRDYLAGYFGKVGLEGFHDMNRVTSKVEYVEHRLITEAHLF